MASAKPKFPLTADAFGDLTEAQRLAVGREVAKMRESGMSARAIREACDADWVGHDADPTGSKSWLSGPKRRKLLRDVERGDLIAPSYEQYVDRGAEVPGDAREGGKHARYYGTRGKERRERDGLIEPAKPAKRTRRTKKTAA